MILLSINTSEAQKVTQDVVDKVLEILKDSLSKNDFDQRITILKDDGRNAWLFNNVKRSGFKRISILNDTLRNPSEVPFLFPQPESVDEEYFIMPPGGFSMIAQRDLSKNIKQKGDTLIYETSRKMYGRHYGIFQEIENFNKFSYVWIFPAEWKPVYYWCNLPGKWVLRDNLLHYISSRPDNDYLFEIRYVRTHTIPKTIEGRTVNYTQTIQVSSDTIQVIINDPQREDGDIISLNVNGDWKLKNYEVTNAPAKFTFTLGYAENYIALHAENVGSIPPNTAMLTIIDGKQRKQIILNSDMGKTEAVLLKRKP